MCNSKVLLFVILFSVCCILPTILFGQVDTAWVRRYHGPGNASEYAASIAVDGQGNVYVTGRSTGSGTEFDYATIKYNSVGVQQWVARYNGIGNAADAAWSIAVDGQGNVYVTGNSASINAIPYNMDYVTIKYNSSGVEQWVQRYNGPGDDNDQAHSIAVDAQGNVYVTGESYGANSYWDYATIKYNSSGAEQWMARYNGTGNYHDLASSIAIDDQGNVYVTGRSYGSSSDYDYVTIKYNSAGIEQWANRYNGPANYHDEARSIAVDGQGNVYVTGTSSDSTTLYDYATIKYNSTGTEQWTARYNGPGNSYDEAYSIAVDNQDNVYVTGYSAGLGSNTDYLTIKYNSAGTEQWVGRYNGPGNSMDWAYSIAVDVQSNVYVTGLSIGSGTSNDYATIKYNSTGTEQWTARYNGPGNSYDEASSIAVDGQCNIYVTGKSYSSTTFYDYATIKYVQTQGVEEIEIATPSARNDFVIYPNPAKTFFTVRSSLFASHSSLKLFDVTGKVILEVKLRMGSLTSLSQRISLDGIKNGIYFVKVGDELIREKLVITK